jgi:hypothetical protein
MAIWRWLDEAGITTPAEIGTAFGMPTGEADKLLTGWQWREGGAAGGCGGTAGGRGAGPVTTDAGC